MSRLPDFIIIGAMKCATSTLHDQLASQPGLFMSTPKEPCFFSNDEIYSGGLEWYQSLFAGADDGDLCGESSTHYTKLPTYPHTVERMREHVPDAKLIYVVRHPIDRLVSHYIHDWTERELDCPIDRAIDEHHDLVAYSRYAMQLKPFLETYGPDRILLVFFERLISARQAELERVCEFIGYRGDPRWQEAALSNESSRRLRKNSLRDALVWNPVSNFVRRRLIPRGLRDWVKGFWQMKRRPEMTDSNRSRLAETFDADLVELAGWLETELSCAGWKETALAVVPQWCGLATECQDDR